MFKPKKFQQNRIFEIATKATQSINQNIKNKIIVLKSPTGSGKTFMLSETIKTISDLNKAYEVCYIWIAPQTLHAQSKNKLESYFLNNKYLKCSYFSDLSEVDGINSNEILFLNWQSINQKNNNVIIRENERNFYLSKVIDITKDAGKKIILIIDESHRMLDTPSALSLINNVIKPDVTIEASATPTITSEDEKNVDTLTVGVDEVKADQLIVDKIILNYGIKSEIEIEDEEIIIDGDKFNNNSILNTAIKRRNDLESKFKKVNSSIKPLLLIQVPDKNTKGTVENLLSEIENTLSDKKITKKNKKLAIYLSEEKVNIEGDKNQPLESVEVLIFKQAIALGWDCPRAQILVIFRDMKSYTFETQTIGRITRFPDPNRGYFKDHELNKAYIYTNLSSIGVKDIWAKSFIDYKSVFIDKNHAQIINLPSWFTKRERERTRLSSEYKSIFNEVAKEANLKNKMKISKNKVTNRFFTEQNVDDISLFKEIIDSDTKAEINDLETLQSMIDIFATDMLRSEYYPESRSIKMVVDSLYRFLKDEFNLNYKKLSDFEKMLKIVLDERNRNQIHSAVQRAIEQHKIFAEENSTKELNFIDKWNIPSELMFGGVTDTMPKKFSTKSILKSKNKNLIIQGKLWKSEKAFIRKLEDSSNVKWWFKNGEGDATYFAVKTIKQNGELAPFYVDFIVFFNDNVIGLFDTKAGNTLQSEDIISKHVGLKKAISDKNYKNFKLRGGIISNTNMDDYSGIWRVFQGSNKENIKDIKLQKSGWSDLVL